MDEKEHIEELKRLFHTAKKFDEFEFVNILIGYNGMGDQRALTHLYESREFIKDIKSLMDSNQNKHTKTRFALLLYCHIFEMDELYNILGNLLRISAGQGLRFIPDLYNRYNQVDLTPSEKISNLQQLAEQARFLEFVNGINEYYNNRIRNAFFHSAYSLIEDDFCLVKGKGIRINGVIHNILSIDKFLTPRINSVLNFIEVFFALIDENKLNYKGNKIIEGHLPNPQPVIILGDPIKGLIGFQSLNGSSIKISNSYGAENFVEAMNIRFTNRPEENTEIIDKLTPYIEKKLPIGKEFEKLKEEIIQSTNKNLIKNIAIIYYNWANNTITASDEKSGIEKEHLIINALKRYEQSIQTDSSFSLAYLNKGVAMLKMATFQNNLNNKIRLEVIEVIKKALKYEPLLLEAHVNYGRLLYDIAIKEKHTASKIALLNQSLEKFNKAIDIYPKDNEAYQYRGKICWELAIISSNDRQINFNTSIENYEMAIKFKADISYYLSIAIILGEFAEFDQKQTEALYEKSIAILDKAQTIYGPNTDILYCLGNKYMRLNHHTDKESYLKLAKSAFESAVSVDNKNIKAWNNLGSCLLHIGMKEENPLFAIALFEDAIVKLNEAIKSEPNHETAYYNLGIIYSEIWRRKDIEAKGELIELAISNLAHGESLKEGLCSYDLARVFSMKGEIEKSIFWLDKFLTNNETKKEKITEEKDFEILFMEQVFKTLVAKHFKQELA